MFKEFIFSPDKLILSV